MMRGLRSLCGAGAMVAFMLTSTLTTTVEAADPAAEALFQDALELMKADKYDEACPKLEASQKREPRSGTLISLGYCHQKQGRTATAWAEYQDAITLAKRQDRPEHVTKAESLAAGIAGSLSKLTIVAPATEGLVVEVDGKATVAGAAIPIDPGTHAIKATAPGYKPWEGEVTVGPDGDQQSITVPELEKAPEPPPPAPVVPAPVAPAPAPPPPPDEGGFSVPVVSWIAFGVAVVGAGVGTATGVIALSKASDLEEQCGGTVCDEALRGDFDSGATMAHVSTASFIVAGVAAATGLTTLLILGPEDGDTTATLTLGPGALGLAGRF